MQSQDVTTNGINKACVFVVIARFYKNVENVEFDTARDLPPHLKKINISGHFFKLLFF